MSRERCNVCRGRKTITLPLYHQLSAVAAAEPFVPQTTVDYQEFPCPQCCEVVTLGTVGAAREEAYVCSLIDDPSFIDHVKEGLAYQIAVHLLKNGYIKFQSGPNDEREMRFRMVGTVGVVHPSKLDTLEQRIAERQAEVAKEVADESAYQIDNWGSHNGHSDILKRDARRLIGEAFRTVIERRSSRAKGQ